MSKISYFNSGSVSDTPIPLEKKACLFYEAVGGVHKDSKGREHRVDEDYLKQLEKNTNSSLANGETIYLINNHKKDDFNSTYGYLDSEVYVKRIEEEDAVDNPKLKSLVGRFALFADKIKITADSLKQQIKEGIKFPNISVGLDMAAMKLKEISMTAMPALAHASLFHEQNSDFMGISGITMTEVLNNKYSKETDHEQAEELLDTFLTVVNNLKYTRDEDLPGGTREAYYQQAIEDYVSKLTEITDIGPDPGYASQTAVQDSINREHTYINENGRPQIVGYNNMSSDAFTMNECEQLQFTMKGNDSAEFIEISLGRKKKKKGLLRRTAELAGAAALGAGALRYGKKAMKDLKLVKATGGSKGLKPKLKTIASSVRGGIKSDIGKVRKKLGRPTKKIKQPTMDSLGKDFDPKKGREVGGMDFQRRLKTVKRKRQRGM